MLIVEIRCTARGSQPCGGAGHGVRGQREASPGGAGHGVPGGASPGGAGHGVRGQREASPGGAGHLHWQCASKINC